jgi:hypothetical protein
MADTWKQVGKGDVVQDRNGNTWTVLDVSRTATTTNARIGASKGTRETTVSVPNDREVTLLYSKASAVRTADYIAVRLGARRVAEPGDGGKGYVCPTDYPEQSTLLAHLYIFHNHIPAAGEEPLAEHTRLHRPENKGRGYVDHVHSPDFGR